MNSIKPGHRVSGLVYIVAHRGGLIDRKGFKGKVNAWAYQRVKMQKKKKSSRPAPVSATV